VKETLDETRRAIEEMCPINKANVKRLALHYAGILRPANKFERVSESFISAILYDTLRTIKHRVTSHPSRGITLR